jgi:hypothetical protein
VRPLDYAVFDNLRTAKPAQTRLAEAERPRTPASSLLLTLAVARQEARWPN